MECSLDKNSFVFTYTKFQGSDVWQWSGKTILENALSSYRFVRDNSGKKLGSSIHVVIDEVIFPANDLLGQYIDIGNQELRTWSDNWKELQRLARENRR